MICFVSRGNEQALYNLHEDRVGAFKYDSEKTMENQGKSGNRMTA